jgi:threonine/homoserine efflux transporter RhtA
MTARSPAFVTRLPIVAVMGNIRSLCVGSSYAKILFPVARIPLGKVAKQTVPAA